jgi:hypothetical protein
VSRTTIARTTAMRPESPLTITLERYWTRSIGQENPTQKRRVAQLTG